MPELTPETMARWRADPLGGQFEAMELALVLRLAGDLQGRAVLDVGCGDGSTLLASAEPGARVSDAERFAMVRRLVREEGLLVGGSSGTNVVAALRVAARGGLDGPVVTVLADGWVRYRAKPRMQEIFGET